MKFYMRSGYYIYEDGATKHYLNVNSVNIKEISSTRLKLFLDLIGGDISKEYDVSEIQDIDGNIYGTTVRDVADAVGLKTDVTLQDQDTPVLIAKFNMVTNTTVTTSLNAIDDYIINVASTTGMSVGSYLSLFHPASVRYMFAEVTAINTLAITLDTPLDFAYPSGTNVDIAVTNMNVDGSSTVKIFGIRGTGSPPGVELTVDITRILFLCSCTSPVNLSLFANFTKLTRGIVLRKRDGTYHNVFNIKSNGEIEGICFDFETHTATNPAQGVDGFSARLTWASQGKMGVVQRLKIGEDLQILIQDDLATAQGSETITLLECTAEGSVVRL